MMEFVTKSENTLKYFTTYFLLFILHLFLFSCKAAYTV